MKYVKIYGICAVAAASLLAFAATASATILTAPPGFTFSSAISAESEGGTSLHGFFTTVSCKSSKVSGNVEVYGTLLTVSGKLVSLTFTECNFPVKVLKAGSLEVHTAGETANGNGTATSSGAEITIETSVANCIFTTNGTDIGTLTGAAGSESYATLDINSAAIPRTGHSIFCGSFGTWTGSYKFTFPKGLSVD